MPTGVYKRTIEHNKINSLSKKGKKKSIEHKRNISLAIRGDNHWSWKGEKASYSSKHKWIVRECGNPNHCAYCKTDKSPAFDWANISQSYKRELSDWIRLCRKCHYAYDHGKITLENII